MTYHTSAPHRRPTALAALAASAAGLIAAVPALPPPLRAVLLLAFVLAGPGSAVLLWAELPRSLRLAVTPALGLAAVIGFTTIAGFANRWSPFVLLAVLAALSAGSALAGLLSNRTRVVHP